MYEKRNYNIKQKTYHAEYAIRIQAIQHMNNIPITYLSK